MGAKYKYKYKYHKTTLVLSIPNKHLAVQRIDIGFKQMWSRCFCRIQGVRMPMSRAPTRFKSITPMIVMLVRGRMLASAAHTGFESISGTRDKHTGGSKRVPTLVHLNQDQPSIQGDEQPFQYWTVADHPIKLFTRI